MKERTCLIIKPDGVGKKVVGKIISSLEEAGLKLLAMKMIKPDRETLEDFYDVHRGKPFFGPFINFMLTGPVITSIWEGENAITRVRKLIGNTNSLEAAPNTLRRLYGTDNRRNIIHASDSPDNAQREIDFFFHPEEILEYDENAWRKS